MFKNELVRGSCCFFTQTQCVGVCAATSSCLYIKKNIQTVSTNRTCFPPKECAGGIHLKQLRGLRALIVPVSFFFWKSSYRKLSAKKHAKTHKESIFIGQYPATIIETPNGLTPPLCVNSCIMFASSLVHCAHGISSPYIAVVDHAWMDKYF